MPFAELDPQHYGESLWEGRGLGTQYDPSKDRFTLICYVDVGLWEKKFGNKSVSHERWMTNEVMGGG